MRALFLTMPLLGLTFSTYAAPIKIDCPQTIKIDQSTDTEDTSWEMIPDAGLPPASLITIAVYTQHPSESGTLVADQSSRSAETQTTTWRLPADFAPYWAACVYSTSRVLLAKKLPDNLKQCTLTEALRGQKANGVVAFLCQ